MKRLSELDRVILAEDLPEHDLQAGDIGTVMLVHDGGYEVEFIALDGETLVVTSVRDEQVRPARHREIAHARSVEG